MAYYETGVEQQAGTAPLLFARSMRACKMLLFSRLCPLLYWEEREIDISTHPSVYPSPPLIVIKCSITITPIKDHHAVRVITCNCTWSGMLKTIIIYSFANFLSSSLRPHHIFYSLHDTASCLYPGMLHGKIWHSRVSYRSQRHCVYPWADQTQWSMLHEEGGESP